MNSRHDSMPFQGHHSLDEDELSKIFYNAPIMMILVDEDRRVRGVNRQTERELGNSEEDLVGLRGGEAFRCIHHLDVPEGCGFAPDCSTCKVRNTVLDTFKTGEGFQKVETTIHVNGNGGTESKHYLVTTQPLVISGKNMVLVSLQDVTTLKEIQARLEESNKELEFYQEVLNHDLNNINQISLGYIDLLRRTPLSEKQLEYLEKVNVAIKKNSFLLSNITQLHMNKDIPLGPVDLVETMSTAIDEVLSIYPEKEINIAFNAKDCTVRANALLKNVFFNIIENAVKYTPGNKVKIEIDVADLSDQVVISVKDNGKGIPDSKKQDIFGKYLRLDKSVKGKGLGLYIVRQLVDAYGGKVWADNNLVDGTPEGTILNVMLLKNQVDETLGL